MCKLIIVWHQVTVQATCVHIAEVRLCLRKLASYPAKSCCSTILSPEIRNNAMLIKNYEYKVDFSFV